MYVKENLNFKRRVDLEYNNLGCIWLDVFLKNSKSILFGCFYRPPGTSTYLSKDYCSILNEHLNKISMEQKEVVMMSDFNIDYNKTWTENLSLLLL